MKTSKGIVAVVFRKREKNLEFLILHRVLNWSGWELLKGGVEKGELLEEAVKREVLEEIGVKKILETKKLRAVSIFFDKVRKCNREMQGFLVKIGSGEKISLEKNIAAEHDDFEWVGAETAVEMLSFSNQKKVFRTALKALGHNCGK